MDTSSLNSVGHSQNSAQSQSTARSDNPQNASFHEALKNAVVQNPAGAVLAAEEAEKQRLDKEKKFVETGEGMTEEEISEELLDRREAYIRKHLKSKLKELGEKSARFNLGV